jgi:four helix bundle protein
MAFLFEKLKVYQKSVDFAESVISITESFPKGYYFLRDQLNRASTSIAANIAEGNGRFTKADRKHFFGIARGSVHECLPFLEIAQRKNLILNETHVTLKASLEEISKMLTGLIRGDISQI